ncbi:MAG: hypothetical protein Q8Q12_01725 [bacterium]|nr:hypothetical protein [bacterium]
MATGSYTGNGTSQSITTVPFTPEIVIVKGDLAQNAVMRTTTTTNTKDLAAASGLEGNLITSLDTHGFTVGSNARVNNGGATYYWVAFNADDVEAIVGSYWGNGGSSQDVSLGFSPKYVIVLPQSTTPVIHRSKSMQAAFKFSACSGVDNSITSLGTNKFTVGTYLNVSGTKHHYVAFKSATGKMTYGSYEGTGTDDRQLTGLTFTPVYLIIKSEEAVSTVHRTESIGSGVDSTLDFTNVGNFTDAIQDFLTSGFELGTHDKVNKQFLSFHYIAFGETYTAARLSSLHTTGLTDQVLVGWQTEAEVDVAGFNVLRAEAAEGPWVKLNPELIPSRGNSWQGASYSFSDEEREAGTVFWYCVEEVSAGGGTTPYTPVLFWDEGLTDADGDKMPDAWEQKIGIGSGSSSDADADADGDGFTNLLEYHAGTSPVDAAECPKLLAERSAENSSAILRWIGRPGRKYELMAADSMVELLSGSPDAICATEAFSSGPMQFEDSVEAGDQMRFYRLSISPPK